MFMDINREIPYIEASYNNKVIGIYVNMHTAVNKLPKELLGKVSFRFGKFNEHRDADKFWTLIRKGYLDVKTR